MRIQFHTCMNVSIHVYIQKSSRFDDLLVTGLIFANQPIGTGLCVCVCI